MDKEVKNTKTVFLMDDSFNFSDTKKFVNDTIEIITFDIFSHNNLKKQNIRHVLSDSFLSKDDYKEIQKKSYEIEQWYNIKELESFLIFENINLGQLTYFDSVVPVTKLLKKFFETVKIFEKYSENNFLTTNNMSNILRYFTDSFQIVSENSNSLSNQKDVHYDYKIGKFNLGLNISYKNYQKFKKLSEKFLSTFFEPKTIPSSQKTVLLVEFDPVKYRNLLLESKNSPLTFILYNNRKPSVWDKTSFDVLKKSGTKIITPNLLHNNKILHDSKIKSENFKQSISKILDKDLSSTYFYFKEYDLWPIFKNILTQLILENLEYLIFQILSTQYLFDTYKIDSVLINSENGSTEHIAINLAKPKNIPVILMQHGLIYESDDFLLRNNLTGIYPNNSDYVIVWGPLMKNHLISLGYEKEKIKDLGCPVYDDISQKPPQNNNTLLVATSPPMSDFAIDLSVATNLNYEKIIKDICIFSKENNLNLIFKLHPSLEDNIHVIIKQNNENAEIISSGNIIPLIEKSSLLITFDLSTTILESQLLSTPVFSISYRENNDLHSQIFEKTCPRVSHDDFENMVKKIIFDDEFRHKLIKNGTDYSNSYMSSKHKSAKSILTFLENIN